MMMTVRAGMAVAMAAPVGPVVIKAFVTSAAVAVTAGMAISNVFATTMAAWARVIIGVSRAAIATR